MSSKSGKRKDDVTVNSRGQVRPRSYDSKYKRVKNDIPVLVMTKSDEVGNEVDDNNHTQFEMQVNKLEVEESQEFEENQEILQQIDQDLEDRIDHISSPAETNEKSGEELAEHKLLDYLKEKEESNVDDLIRILEMEHKWINDANEEEVDEEEELDEQDDSLIKEDDPIQPGHFLSVKISVLLIWLLAMTHSYTSQMLSDTLTIIRLHMMNGYPALKSLYSFKRFFQNLKSPFIKHYYCSFCFTKVTDNKTHCDNQMCGKDLSEANARGYFVELPIISQLNAFFSRDEFRSGLKYRNERVKKNEGNIEDVYDSENYKNLMKNGGPLSPENENNISFVFNTDGIPIFKSSKTSAWPVFLMINELPYRMRKSRENMIMCGLWFGKDKPRMNLFCQPFHDSLLELEKGVDVQINGQEEKIKVHGYLYSVSCDIPARSSVMNMNQHNGECCCPKCLQTGINYRTPTGGNVRIFPYQKEDSSGPNRDSLNILQDAQKAVTSAKISHINGIKGPSFLMFCPMYDPVKNISIDIMHLLYLGIVRMMMKLWFGVSHSLQPFSLYRYTDIVDSRIIRIKPSHLITRMPRSISEHLKFWKAAELRSWFFYYSLPCIADIIHPRYLYHYCALLEGIFLLNQSSISDNDIAKSERLLNCFVFMFPCLYYEKCVTINVHSLLHLPDIVKKIGPLWSTSCFAFESANGDLLKLFHGTQYIDIQIVNAVHVFQMLPSLSSEIQETSEAYPLVCSLMKKKQERSIGFTMFGKAYNRQLDNQEYRLVCEFSNTPFHKISFYRRAILRGIMYHSLDYTRTKTRNSYTVKYRNKEGCISFGYICWYAELDHFNGKIMLACISILKNRKVCIFEMHHEGITADCHIKSNFMNLTMPHIHYVEENAEKCIIPLENILDLCLCVKFDGFTIVCEEPNHHEINL